MAVKRGPTSPSAWGAVVLSGAATTVSMLPPFLVGALAVQLTADLGFANRGLGAATGVFFALAAASSFHLGRLTDRLGATRALRLASSGSMFAMIGIATTAANWGVLALWLAVAGTAHSLAQPGSNRLLANRVATARLGLAMGIKQSAPPLASALAGLSVPLVALTVGWRWAFVIGATLAVSTALSAVPQQRSRLTDLASGRRPTVLRDRPTIALLAFGFALGLAANSSLLTFFVVSAVSAGTPPRIAGVLFAAGSITAILTRLAAGAICDRTDLQPLRLCAALLVTGAGGLLVLSLERPTIMAIGVLMAMVGTWGYPGVFWLALIRAYPEAPGRITGALAPGSLGGIAGPILFGVLVDSAGYRPAWITTAAIACLSAGIMGYGARRLARPVRAE